MNETKPKKSDAKKKKVRPASTKRKYEPERATLRKIRNFARSSGGDYLSVPGARPATVAALKLQEKERQRRERREQAAQYDQGRARTRARRARRERVGESFRRRMRRQKVSA